MALLEVDSIDVFYGQIQALREVSLHVDEGEMIALIGANGAGKTTTLRTISGLHAPSTGTIRFAGEDIHGMPAYDVVRKGIAHLPEGRELFAALPVIENLKLGYWPRRKDKAKLQSQLDLVMDHFPRLRERANQAAGTLSGGEQQMLGVARALMSNPKLLVVDELSLGLAPIIVSQLFEILDEVNQEGTSVLIVEQFVHLALKHTARAYVLQKGQVVAEGPSSKLLADPALVATYLGETPEMVEAAEELEHRDEKPARRKPAAKRAPVAKRAPASPRKTKTKTKTKRAARR
jgi:branched-chain amino acid transport system ATP-binding protein